VQEAVYIRKISHVMGLDGRSPSVGPVVRQATILVRNNIPPTGSEQEVTHLWQGLILAVPQLCGFGNLFLEKTSGKDFNVQAARGGPNMGD
jgi:hypothetical protein